MQIIKLFLVATLSFILSGCIHIKTPEENLKDLENGTVAAVVSGCSFIFIQERFLLPDKEDENTCGVRWKTESGETVYFHGYHSVKFITPGTYEFSGFTGDIDPRTYIYYDREKDAPPMFNNFAVKGGEVIYIGNFDLDTRNSKKVLQSITAFSNYKYAKNGLSRLYPSLVEKLENRAVKITPLAQTIRDYFPTLEEEE